MYCISKDITGIERDLIFDKDKKLINRKEKIETDLFIGSNKDTRSISYYSKYANKSLELDIPIKYRNMWSFIKKDPNWSDVLGIDRFVNMCMSLIKNTESFLNEEKEEYYHKIAPMHYKLFDEISEASIDEKNLVKYLSSIDQYRAKQILKQISDNRKKYKRINYSIFNTTTGRMTITSGINLLTLKKENRNIIGSSYENGKILEIDIKNLEPRILMGMFNKEVPYDIYSWISKDVLHDISIDRDFVKELTFKILYGASMNTIKKDLDWLYDIEDIVNRIKSNTGYHELAVKIKNETSEGFFRNFYGRRLKKSSADINHYLQSTGVDVSLFCFQKINSILKHANMKFKIIGFIHDAMLIDCDNSSALAIQKNLNKKNVSIEGFNNKFPIIITEVK